MADQPGKAELSAVRFKNKMEDISNDLDDTYRTDSVISVNCEGKVELGPCWRKIPPASVEELLKVEPSRLVPVHCRCRGEEISWNQWSDKPFTSWPTYEEAWTTWVGKMLPYYGDHWKKANIYDAIMLSARRFLPDKALLSAGFCFWNSSSNTLDLPLGMMSVSLLDVAAIAGFRPHGTSYDCTGELGLKTKFSYYFHGRHEAYGSWIAQHNRDWKPNVKSNKVLVFEDFQHIKETMQTTRITDQEHISFLLYWLCRYVFCVPSIGIEKEWSHLAQVLHQRTDVALGELVLASLYRGLQKITANPFDGKAQGPFWLFQMWLQIYFPDLGAVSTFPADEVMGFALTNQIPKLHSPRDCFATLWSFKSNPFWTHTLTRRYPSFLRNRFIDGSTSDSALDEEIEAVLTSVVVQRDLLYGGIKTGKYYGVQAEFYGPNHFSRQFGCIQGIPYSGHESVNCYTSWRDVLINAAKIRGVSNSFRSTKLKPFLTRYLPTSETTPGFDKWWHSQTKGRFSAEHYGPFAILYMHFPFRDSYHLEVPGFPPAVGEREEGEEGEAKVESSLPTNKNRKRKRTTNAPVSTRRKTTEVTESGMKTNGFKDEEAEEIDGRHTLNTFGTMKKLRPAFSSDTVNIKTEEPEQTEGPLMGTVELGSEQMCSDDVSLAAFALIRMHRVQCEPTTPVPDLIESNVGTSNHEKLKVWENNIANSASVEASKPANDDPAEAASEPEQTEGTLMGTVELGSEQMCSDAAALAAIALIRMHRVQCEPTMLVPDLIESNMGTSNHEKLKVGENNIANSASVEASKPAEDDPAEAASEPEQTEGPLLGTVELGSEQMCSDAAALEAFSKKMHGVQSEPTTLVQVLLLNKKFGVLKIIVFNSASVKASKPAEEDPACSVIANVVRRTLEKFEDIPFGMQGQLMEALNFLGGRVRVNHAVINKVEEYFNVLTCIKEDKTRNSKTLTLLQDLDQQRRDVRNKKAGAEIEAKKLVIPFLQRVEKIIELDKKIKVLVARKRMMTQAQNIADERLAPVDLLRAQLSKHDLQSEILKIKLELHSSKIWCDTVYQLIDETFGIFFWDEICGTKGMLTSFLG
ncbi:uncharacterized protein LOC133718567 isoform X2 [Rosa rugosa]|uniref:uncharacterized protein LOC133718567 isoform X2 n=1 Tax=Rosa rugosa TaxID=74645 RepID=UPI002B411398|nr:uncharacterized protein LOC133718567 isoform X2 [Rosa rugosa]